jgi:integrase
VRAAGTGITTRTLRGHCRHERGCPPAPLVVVNVGGCRSSRRVLRVRKQLASLVRDREPRRVKTKSRASVREVPLLDRAYEALLVQLETEQSKGSGAQSDFVFTSATGRPLDRHRLSKRGVSRAAERAGLGHVTAQTLRRSVATATAHARLPVAIAAAMTGHSRQVYDAHYAKPFGDVEERDRVRQSLASIGFGNVEVDQMLTNEPPETSK